MQQSQRVEVCLNGAQEPHEHILSWKADSGVQGLMQNILILHDALHSAPSKERMQAIAAEAAEHIIDLDPSGGRFAALRTVASPPLATRPEALAYSASLIEKAHISMSSCASRRGKLLAAQMLLSELLAVGSALHKRQSMH